MSAVSLVPVSSSVGPIFRQRSEALEPPIQIIPDEVVVEILKESLGDNIPSQRYALICKRWTRVLRETGTFWRNFKAQFVPRENVQFHASRFRRRLELSQATLLDITLDMSQYFQGPSPILFEILSSVDVQRWRSLTLARVRTYNTLIFPVGYFRGTFTALRSLCWEEDTSQDSYQPIYDLLVHSPPTLRTIHTKKAIPASLRSPAILGKVLDLTIPTQFYAEVYMSMCIETVCFTNSHNVDFALLPPLPKAVKFDVVSSNSLAVLNLAAVQHLEVFHYVIGDAHRIELPSLMFLALPKNIRYINIFVAPALVSLRLGHDNLWGRLKQTESTRIIDLFAKDRNNLSMAPTTLDMYLSITAEAAVAVLSHWSQIRDLSLDLTFGEPFAWQGDFSEALKADPNSVCPNLVALKLRTRWDNRESDEWRREATAMFKARHLCPLEMISWTHIVGKKETLTVLLREEVEGLTVKMPKFGGLAPIQQENLTIV